MVSRSRFRRAVDLLRRTPLHPQWLLGSNREMVARIASLPKGRILDIGCANRWVAGHLPSGCQYVGVDYPATGGLLYGSRPDVFADAARLPVRDGVVDALVMLEVLEHLRFPSAALCEAARVLRPGGRLLLSVPFLYPIHDAPHDFQRFTTYGLAREIESAGLIVVEVVPSLGSAQSAGLVACLALAGMSAEAVRHRRLSLMLVPFLLIALPAVNLLAWVAGRMLPSWSALTAGYVLVASKP